MSYQVIQFYRFVEFPNPESLKDRHKQFCRDLGIKGRIYIGSEGINGTVGGTSDQIDAYKRQLRKIDGLEDLSFKTERSHFNPFPRLQCKTRDEIVSLHAEESLDTSDGGEYMEPDEWRKIMESDEDYIMIDVRNDYETRIGHFEGAMTPNLENFYEFSDWIKRLDVDRDRKVLMYCTGGIRCEKFSALMKSHGYKDVHQLHGGILRYKHEQGGKHFRGKCFVFDDRLVVPVNPQDLEPIARCEITGKPADSYINCANMECNKLFVCSKEGARQMEGCCSEACRRSEYKRPFDPENAFKPFRKWYHYFDQDFKERKLKQSAAG